MAPAPTAPSFGAPVETLFDWQKARDEALALVAKNAGNNFLASAMRHAVKFLRENGPASGEDITNSCKEAGIVPPNTDKAFGAVIRNLSKDGIIAKAGFCQRKKGHLTAGGLLWKVTESRS